MLEILAMDTSAHEVSERSKIKTGDIRMINEASSLVFFVVMDVVLLSRMRGFVILINELN
jgi:hypothetical protein